MQLEDKRDRQWEKSKHWLKSMFDKQETITIYYKKENCRFRSRLFREVLLQGLDYKFSTEIESMIEEQ